MRAAWLWAGIDMRRRWKSLVVVGLLIAFAFGSTMALVAGARRAGSATARFTVASDLAEVLAFVGQDPDSDTAVTDRIIAGRFVWSAIVGNANVIVHVDVPAYRAARLQPALALRSE